MSREYKGLVIPDRMMQDDEYIDIDRIQAMFCGETDCGDVDGCDKCLLNNQNIKQFEEWYMAKNKSKIEE